MDNPYVVVQEDTIYKLEIEVRRLLDLGYAISGSLAVLNMGGTNNLFMQPMIKFTQCTN